MGEWKEYKLSDVCLKIGSGATPTGGGNSYKLQGISLIRSQNILDFQFSRNGLAFIDDEQAYDLRNVTVEKDDILLNITGDSVARTCKVPASILPARVNQHVSLIRANRGLLDPDYLLYYIQSIKPYLLSISEIGATRRALTKGMIEDLDISLPPLPEQKSIASIFSSLDDKIDLLNRQNKTLEGMAEALWRKMFVEEADPGWKKGKLGDMIITIESGRRPKGGIDPDLQFGIPSIGAENIIGIGNYDHNKTKYVSEEFYYKMNSGKIQGYDVLIYKDGAYIGRKSMFARGFPFEQCCVNEHVFILRTKDINTQIFLYFLLEQEELEQLNANSAQPGLNQESMKSFEIFIPDEKYIEQFGSETKAIIDKIFYNSIQIHTLSKIRDTLLPKLMSGDVRINGGCL